MKFGFFNQRHLLAGFFTLVWDVYQHYKDKLYFFQNWSWDSDLVMGVHQVGV